MNLNANFLGNPNLVFNGTPLTFSTQKITALTFYLISEKEALRSQLATLFWGEKTEEAALASLRNAIYLIKKMTPKPIFLIDRKKIRLSPEIHFITDLDALEQLAHCPLPELKRMNTDFMSGVMLPNCDLFENWLLHKRQEISEKIARKIDERIQIQYPQQRYEDVVQCLKILIARDSFDERNYLRLMHVYAVTGQTSKAIKLFMTLKRVLSEELRTQPGAEAQKLYDELLEARRAKVSPAPFQTGFPFFGRTHEINMVLSHLKKHVSKPLVYISISGSAGIGKSALVNHLLQQLAPVSPVWCRAYEISEKYALSPWNGFFGDLKLTPQAVRNIDPIKLHLMKMHFPSFNVNYTLPGDTDFSPLLQPCNPIQLGTLLAEITRVASVSKKLLVIIEDFQWFDQASVEMLQSFLLSKPGNLTLIALQRTGNGSARQTLLERLASKNGMQSCKISLTPFTEEETKKFCELSLHRSLSEEETEQLQAETEGIPLLISELLNVLQDGKSLHSLTDRIAGVIESRIAALTTGQRQILEYLSIFASEAFYNDFIALFEKDSLYLAEDIEILCKKNFIRERITDSNNLKLQFCHHRLQSYVYSQISEFKKRALHGKVAAILEKTSRKIVWDKELEYETIFHHNKAANEPGALNFHLARLQRHVTINHELFPIIEDTDLRLCGLPFSTQTMTEKRLDEAEKLLLEIKSRYPASEDILKASALYQEIRGGYNIYFGNYGDGRYSINQAFKYAESRQQTDMMMRCLLHLSFIGIQTEKSSSIAYTAKSLCSLAYRHNNELFIAIALRFLGICHQIDGNSYLSEQLFKQSISRLEKIAQSGVHYTLHIVAAQNYIGELHHRQGNFQAAIEHFKYCLSQCIDNNLFWGMPLFHSNIAYVYLCINEYSKAETHVDQAIRLFETTPSGRKNSIAYSIKAFLEAQKGNSRQALENLYAGNELCQPIEKKSWMALHLWVKAQLKRMPLFSVSGLAEGALKRSAEEYEREAAYLFKGIHFDSNILGI